MFPYRKLTAIALIGVFAALTGHGLLHAADQEQHVTHDCALWTHVASQQALLVETPPAIEAPEFFCLQVPVPSDTFQAFSILLPPRRGPPVIS